MSFLMFEVFPGLVGSFRYIWDFWAVLKVYVKFWGKRRDILSFRGLCETFWWLLGEAS